MSSKLFLASILSITLLGSTQLQAEMTSPAKIPTYAADNTKQNLQDRDTMALTPMNQGENSHDLTITQDIRKALVSSDMSTDAKNIKVITVNNIVTLRGVVMSSNEKSMIDKIANAVVGVQKVDNQLLIKEARQ